MMLTRRHAVQSAAIAALTTAGAGARAAQPSSAGDLARMDAVASAAAVRDRHVSAKEVVDSAIERAARLDKSLNAVTTKTFETARTNAERLSGPWAGVPFIVKDLTDVAGVPTGYGSRAFNGFVPTTQSELVDKMFALGLVSLGKSATPEFGLTATTEPLSHGAARNPWNLGHSTGGSSGGAAALVAAGVVPVAHASDGGGSIRVPASCCGNVGLKVTRGRLPWDHPPRAFELSVHGVQSRSVRDTAAFLAAMEVKNDLPPVGLVEGASAARRKIAVFADSPVGGPIDPQSRSAARAAARTLEKLGHHVEEIAPPFDAGVLLDFGVLWSAGAAEVVGKWEKQAGRTATYDDFEPFTLALTAEFGKVKDQFSAVLARLRSFEAIYEAKFSDYDVLLSPTLGAPPPEIGYLSTAYRYETVAQRLSDYVCFTPYMNISGAPAISLPLGMSKQKLPIGVQLAAAKGQERTLLELAYELEAASPWSNRTPPLFA